MIDFFDAFQQVQSSPRTPGEILAWVQFNTGSWAGAIQSGLAVWARRGLAVVIALMVAVYGYQIMFGWTQGTIETIFQRLALIIIVIVLTMASVFWWPSLYGFFTAVPQDIANIVILATGVSGDAPTLIDQVLEKGFETGSDFMAQAGFTAPTGFIVGILVWIFTLLFVGLMFSLIGMSYFMVALLLGLAPMLVIALAFQTTRAMFERWLSLLFNFALIPVITFAVGTLVMVGAANALSSIGTGSATLEMIIPYLVWCILGFGVLLQVPSVCAALGGGIAMSGAQALAGLAASGVASAMTTSGRLGAKVLGYGTGITQRLDTRKAAYQERVRRAAVKRVNAEEKKKDPNP